MKQVEYDSFVRQTDQYAKKERKVRHAVALYGLVGEIGSLVSAVKKKILAESGESDWDQPSEEITNEIGDALWYAYSLAQVANDGPFDILGHDIALLKREINGENERAEKIRGALNPANKDAFLAAAGSFPPASGYSFDDYQKLAFKTARTDGRILLEVCLAVLSQLGAELLRTTLPEIELTINKNVADRPVNTLLGEVTWHLAAIASLYHLSLDDVVAENKKKVGFRAERGAPTPLHDDGRPPAEQFPRQFDISFVRISPKKSRMYLKGRRLGDDLTDNANEDDGYRFHDAIHLALIARMGWSPVFRGFMGKKRPDVDEVQDGGRAKVVEELIVKAIHTEGEKQARSSGRCSVGGAVRLFPEPSTITFSVLKTLRTYVEGLEVWNNAYWEWEDAICEGCDLFFQLRTHTQGTVHLDLENRKAIYTPTVYPSVSGNTVSVGMGTATVDDAQDDILTDAEIELSATSAETTNYLAAKRALIEALGLTHASPQVWKEAAISLSPGNKISVDASGAVQDRIWEIGAVDFKIAFTQVAGQAVCTLAAIADPDLKPLKK